MSSVSEAPDAVSRYDRELAARIARRVDGWLFCGRLVILLAAYVLAGWPAVVVVILMWLYGSILVPLEAQNRRWMRGDV